VGSGATPAAELVSDEARKGVVLFGDLQELAAREALAAPAATGRFRAGDQGSVDVLASLPAALEVCALAKLAAAAERDLVNGGFRYTPSRSLSFREEPFSAIE